MSIKCCIDVSASCEKISEKSNDDFSRWTMVHEIWKNGDTLSAVITVDGAWMDTVRRKLTIPPKSFKEIFSVISNDTAE